MVGVLQVFVCLLMCLLPALLLLQAECTNTLKTLMALYDDAATRDPAEGAPAGAELLRSPNEIEFRCYFLLMFVDDKEDLQAAQMLRRLPPEALDSQPIRLVCDITRALSTGNFVQFFKVARTATFLQSCMLHRYFNSVRFKALEMLLHTHAPPKSPVVFSLQYLTDLFWFPDVNVASQFLRAIGVQVVPQPKLSGALGVDLAAPREVPRTGSNKNAKTPTAAQVPPSFFEPRLIPGLLTITSRREIIDAGLWALESNAVRLGRDPATNTTVRVANALSAKQRTRRQILANVAGSTPSSVAVVVATGTPAKPPRPPPPKAVVSTPSTTSAPPGSDRKLQRPPLSLKPTTPAPATPQVTAAPTPAVVASAAFVAPTTSTASSAPSRPAAVAKTPSSSAMPTPVFPTQPPVPSPRVPAAAAALPFAVPSFPVAPGTPAQGAAPPFNFMTPIVPFPAMPSTSSSPYSQVGHGTPAAHTAAVEQVHGDHGDASAGVSRVASHGSNSSFSTGLDEEHELTEEETYAAAEAEYIAFVQERLQRCSDVLEAVRLRYWLRTWYQAARRETWQQSAMRAVTAASRAAASALAGTAAPDANVDELKALLGDLHFPSRKRNRGEVKAVASPNTDGVAKKVAVDAEQSPAVGRVAADPAAAAARRLSLPAPMQFAAYMPHVTPVKVDPYWQFEGRDAAADDPEDADVGDEGVVSTASVAPAPSAPAFPNVAAQLAESIAAQEPAQPKPKLHGVFQHEADASDQFTLWLQEMAGVATPQ